MIKPLSYPDILLSLPVDETLMRAYKDLVQSNQRAGTYAMPRAAVMTNFAPL